MCPWIGCPERSAGGERVLRTASCLFVFSFSVLIDVILAMGCFLSDMLCFLPSVYGLSTRCPAELYVLGYSTGTCVYVFCPMLYVLTGVVLVYVCRMMGLCMARYLGKCLSVIHSLTSAL